MNIQELRMVMMKSKKENPEKAKVLQAIFALATLIAKEDGNREATDTDIVAAAKKEAKMAKQSQESGAPFNPLTFEVCDSFMPIYMAENVLKEAIMALIAYIDKNNEKSPKIMGSVMKRLKELYDGKYDPSIASTMIKELLS